MTDAYEFTTIEPASCPQERAEIIALLGRCGLSYEAHIEVFVTCRMGRRLIACGGLESNIVKCVAIEPEFRGGSLSLTLLSEIVRLAYDRSHSHLFLYTRPENVSVFQGCGFYPLAEVPGYVTLMENTPVCIKAYCQRLQAQRQPGTTIGAIVMNANPFTLGHQYLVRLAARQCDWLHVFVVSEDVSLISYADRHALVENGVRDIPNLTLHHGSHYMISQATFPCYFFKEQGVVGDCCTAIDLLLFRDYIAPALGISHRFVGTEPFCPTTRKYNEDMMYWLQTAPAAGPAITVVEETRKARDDVPISASEVRRLLRNHDLARINFLVPRATLDLLKGKYMPAIASCDSTPESEDLPRPAVAARA